MNRESAPVLRIPHPTSLPSIEAVLFDFDGTFADTAPDLALALNRQRAARGRPPLPLEQIRRVASSGARGLLKLGFDLAPGDAGYEAMRAEFLDFYEQGLCDGTRLFPGIEELLGEIERRGLRWGIVTNKASRFTLPLVKLLAMSERAACVICGDSTPHLKPHPAPLLAAAVAIALAPGACVYLGDDERDVHAARAAGMRAAVAGYGYLGNGAPPSEWPADCWVDRPQDLLGYL